MAVHCANTAATVVLLLMMRTRMILSRRECVALLVLYVAFLVWIGAETFGVLDWVPSLSPAS